MEGLGFYRNHFAVAIRCESCHGTADAYAPTQPGTAWDGTTKNLAVDSKGNVLDHVHLAADGHHYLRGRLDGVVHFIPQTRDVVHNIYIRKVEKVGGELHNVEFATYEAVKDPIKAAKK